MARLIVDLHRWAGLFDELYAPLQPGRVAEGPEPGFWFRRLYGPLSMVRASYEHNSLLPWARRRNASPAPGSAESREDARYLAAIDGLAYGGTIASGYVERSRVLLPACGLGAVLPHGFRGYALPSGVNAAHAGDAVIAFGTPQPPTATDPAKRLADWATLLTRPRRPQLDAVEALEVDGLRGATAHLHLENGAEAYDLRLATVGCSDGRSERILLVAPPKAFAALDGPFRAMVGTLQRLEGAVPAPLRLAVVSVGVGDTVDSLASRMAFADHRRERFMALNGLAADTDIKPGMLVKLVVEG
jgi:predicted Zn-dependent protease